MNTKPGITWEEFIAAGKEGQRWEHVDGEVAFMSPVFRSTGRVNMTLDYELEAFSESIRPPLFLQTVLPSPACRTVAPRQRLLDSAIPAAMLLRKGLAR